jgi:hypothetical protein
MILGGELGKEFRAAKYGNPLAQRKAKVGFPSLFPSPSCLGAFQSLAAADCRGNFPFETGEISDLWNPSSRRARLFLPSLAPAQHRINEVCLGLFLPSRIVG